MLSFEHLSYWEKRAFLEGIDVCIIGSGIVGMTTAFWLKKAQPKLKILILERGYLPSGASTKNAGFACFGSPTEIADDLTINSENEVWKTVSLRYEGLRKLFEIVDPKNIKYEPCGSWDLLKNDQEISADFIDYLNEKVKIISGYEKCYSVDNQKIKFSGLKGFSMAYKNALEGSIHTDLLHNELHKNCIEKGIKFMHKVRVLQLLQGNTIETNFGELTANHVVVCTNGLARELLNLEVSPARAQVVVSSPISDLKIQGTFHFEKGYYYFRNVGNRVLFGGGRNTNLEGEKTNSLETTPELINHLYALMKENILPDHSFKLDYQWAGTMGIGPTKEPIVTRIDNHVFAGVRMGGMGVAIGAMVGEKLSKLVLNG